MSLVLSSSTFDPYEENWSLERRPRLAEQLCNVSRFLRGLRVRMRYGELTRAPLRLLRLNILGEDVKCDWLARAPDAWDVDLAQHVRERHSSLQTLRDAIDVRALLFESLPQVVTADLRVFRETSSCAREMIMTGCVQRNDHSSRSIHSLAMRAKVLGFRFYLEDDVLCRIPAEDQIRVDD
jgi:hypothetical protein